MALDVVDTIRSAVARAYETKSNPRFNVKTRKLEGGVSRVCPIHPDSGPDALKLFVARDPDTGKPLPMSLSAMCTEKLCDPRVLDTRLKEIVGGEYLDLLALWLS